MEALRGAAPQSNDAGEVPIVTNSHFHGLEDRWRRTLLIAIPFGALAFFLGMALEGPSNQVSAYDQYTYPVMGFALVALELTLLFFPRRLRFVVLAIVAGSSAFFLGKLIYLLFLFPANQGVLRQMTETFYWIPIIYLLSFLIPNVTGGRATAMSFTVLVLVVSAGYIGAHLVPLHWTHPGDEHWGVVYALAELNLANSVMLALTFAFIGFKERYTRARTEMETMDRVANTDLLTELPNRRRLNRELEKALVRADESNSQLAVLFVDLDRFKTINDTLGHEAGDELLRQVGVRLRATVRDDDLVARLSGDEFVVVVQHVSGRDQVTLLAERLLTALSKPFRVKEIELQVTASIGMAIFPWDARDARALIRHADSAMYKVKRTGKNGIRHYHKESDAEIERRSELERDMGRALKEDQLRLHYQPIYDLNSGELVMVEALLRWEHPEHGMISPGEFVPLAEQSGQIIAIGSWVLTEACRQVASWHRHQLGDFRLSVNVSLLQFSQTGFYDTIRQALHDSGLAPGLLELELTESTVIDRYDDVIPTLRDLRRLGVRIAIDDFGTGYSSLAYLRDLPIDTLKIDRSFVHDLGAPLKGPQFALALVEAITRLAQHLDLEIVAEGIESGEQCDLLRDLGCHLGQGYWFSRPMAGDAVEMLLQPLKEITHSTASRLLN